MILTYFRKHKQLIEENLSLCADPQDIEAVHNLRLSIKRLRVLARLTELIDPKFDAKAKLRETNKLFKRAGRIRDIQITSQLFIDYQNQALDPVIERLRQREEKQRLRFDQALSIFNKEVLNDFESRLTEVLKGKSIQYNLGMGQALLSDWEIEVHELFHGNTKEKRMHDIRTRLKDINYLNNIFDDQLPVREQLNISIERLKELGEIAGTWHDDLNLETELGKFMRKHPDLASIESLKEIISEIRVKKQGLYQEYSCILMNEMKV